MTLPRERVDRIETAALDIHASLNPSDPPNYTTDQLMEAAYEVGYDDGCDDPESVWTSTLTAEREKVLIGVRALADELQAKSDEFDRKGKATEALCFLCASMRVRAITDDENRAEREPVPDCQHSWMQWPDGSTKCRHCGEAGDA